MKQVIVILSVILGLSIARAASAQEKHQHIELQVTEKGFEPSQIDVKPGTVVTLKVTRKTDNTCATTIQVPSKKIKKELPLNKTVSIELGRLDEGKIRFACGMDMMSGQLVVH